MKKLLMTTAIFLSLTGGAGAATLTQGQLNLLRLSPSTLETLRLSQLEIEALQVRIEALQGQQLKLLNLSEADKIRLGPYSPMRETRARKAEELARLEKKCWMPPGAKYVGC